MYIADKNKFYKEEEIIMLSGPLLIAVFILSVAILLITIVKFKMNAFVSLLLTYRYAFK